MPRFQTANPADAPIPPDAQKQAFRDNYSGFTPAMSIRSRKTWLYTSDSISNFQCECASTLGDLLRSRLAAGLFHGHACTYSG
ncbi:hypothetical protein PG995_004427 [Apiospora arundinis]